MAIEPKVCSNCGKLFNYVFGDTCCPECKELLEKKFAEIKDYVWDHKGVTIPIVAKEFDISEKIIKQWVKEDRLSLAPGSAGIPCEKCGKIILSGRLCEECRTKTLRALNDAYKEEPPKIQGYAVNTNQTSKGKMRFL